MFTDKGLKIIKKVRKSEDGRRLTDNFISLTLLQICGYVFPILTLPYLARVLGLELFGAISFALAVVWYFQTVVDWGFFLISTREIAQNRNNREAVCKILSVTVYSKLLLMVCCMAILAIMTAVLPVFRENMALMWFTFLIIPGHIMFPEWFFQGLERMKYITVLNFIVKSLFTCLIFIFIKSPDDYLLQPVLSAVGYLIAGIIAMYIILLKWHYKLVKVSFKECLAAIKGSADVFINNLMPNLYNSFSVLMLGIWYGNAANGILEGGAKFVTVSCNFLGIVSRTFFPFLARRKEKHRVYAKINLSVALVVSVCLFIFAPQIVHLFLTGEFEDSITVLRILSVTAFFVSVAITYGSNYLIINKQERLCRNITVIVSVFAMACSCFLVYYYGWLGAACAMLIGRTLLGIGLYLGARHVRRRHII